MDTVVKEYVISAFTENHAGVLNRITSVFLRRKINIESIKVSESSIKGISMFTIITYADEGVVSRLVKQIEKVVDVLKAEYYASEKLLAHEIALFKVSKGVFDNIEKITSLYPIQIMEVGEETVVLELTGCKEKIDALRDYLKAQELLVQVARSGSVILHTGTAEDMLSDLI